jgi:hypothetical protein
LKYRASVVPFFILVTGVSLSTQPITADAQSASGGKGGAVGGIGGAVGGAVGAVGGALGGIGGAIGGTGAAGSDGTGSAGSGTASNGAGGASSGTGSGATGGASGETGGASSGSASANRGSGASSESTDAASAAGSGTSTKAIGATQPTCWFFMCGPTQASVPANPSENPVRMALPDSSRRMKHFQHSERFIALPMSSSGAAVVEDGPMPVRASRTKGSHLAGRALRHGLSSGRTIASRYATAPMPEPVRCMTFCYLIVPTRPMSKVQPV